MAKRSIPWEPIPNITVVERAPGNLFIQRGPVYRPDPVINRVPGRETIVRPNQPAANDPNPAGRLTPRMVEAIIKFFARKSPLALLGTAFWQFYEAYQTGVFDDYDPLNPPEYRPPVGPREYTIGGERTVEYLKENFPEYYRENYGETLVGVRFQENAGSVYDWRPRTIEEVIVTAPKITPPRTNIQVRIYYRSYLRPEAGEPAPNYDPDPEPDLEPAPEPETLPDDLPEPANDPEYDPEPEDDPRPFPGWPWPDLPPANDPEYEPHQEPGEDAPPDIWIPWEPAPNPKPEQEPEPLEDPDPETNPEGNPEGQPIKPPLRDPNLQPEGDPLVEINFDNLPKEEINGALELKVGPGPSLEFRSYVPRLRYRNETKRRKDKKSVNTALYRAGLRMINRTYGTYSEVMDLVHVIENNVYLDGKALGDMDLEEKKAALKYIEKHGLGTVRIDWEQLVVDFGVNQATDYAIGRASDIANQALIDMDISPGHLSGAGGK